MICSSAHDRHVFSYNGATYCDCGKVAASSLDDEYTWHGMDTKTQKEEAAPGLKELQAILAELKEIKDVLRAQGRR